jgi:hypothetical protein
MNPYSFFILPKGGVVEKRSKRAKHLHDFCTREFRVGLRRLSFRGLANGPVDTASSFLFLDNNIIMAYYAKVNGAKNIANEGGWVFPCNATLPSISFQIGAHRAVMPGSMLVFEALDATSKPLVNFKTP